MHMYMCIGEHVKVGVYRYLGYGVCMLDVCPSVNKVDQGD